MLPQPRPWSFDRDVGIAYLTHERSCVVSRADDWQSDTQVQIVEPASGRSARAVVVGPLDACAATSTGDGQSEFLRSGTSTEGVHLTIWSGAVLTGPRRWHGYHYLGFDVAPTCTEKDVDP